MLIKYLNVYKRDKIFNYNWTCKNNAIYRQAKTIKCKIDNKMVTSKNAVYKTNSLWLIVQCKEKFIYTVSV